MAKTFKHQLLYEAKRNPCVWHYNFSWPTRRKRLYRKVLQRQFRYKIKQLLKSGRYDCLPTRPLRYAWFVW